MKYETIVTDKRTKTKKKVTPGTTKRKTKNNSTPGTKNKLINQANHLDYFNAKSHALEFLNKLNEAQMQNLYDASTLMDFFNPHELRATISQILTERKTNGKQN